MAPRSKPLVIPRTCLAMTVALEVVAEHIQETRRRDREDASEVLSSVKRRRPAKKRGPDDR